MTFLFSVRPNRRAPSRFRNQHLAVTFLTACLFISHTALAAAAALPLSEAQQLALERSRQVVAQDASVIASREMAVAASQLPDPVLKVGIDNLSVNGPERGSLTADFMTMRRIGVMQEITRADKRALRAERFAHEAEKNLAEKGKTIVVIERETALAWLDRYYAEAMAMVIAEQGEQAKRELLAAESAYRAGRGNQADLLAAKSAVVQFDDRISDVARRVRNARIMLTRWIGEASERPLAGTPDMASIRLDPDALDTQLVHHPDIAVLTRQADIAQIEARLAEAGKKSDWTVELAYQQRGPAYSNMVSVGVSIPLQWDQKNRQDRELAAKLAMAEQAKAERDEILRAHVAETRIMLAEWQNNRERLSRYAHELIPLAQERTQAVLAAYRGGQVMLTDVLAARRNELDVHLSALQLEADTAQLWVQLNFLFPTTYSTAATGVATNRDMK